MKAVRELEKFKALSKGKKTAVIVGAIAIVLVVALIVYFLVRPEPGTPVTLVSVQKGDIQQELIATGTIESDNQTDFSLLEGTKVLTVNVKVGDHVKKGDVLAVAQVAGIMAAKKNSEFIPMCHPIAITSADISFELDAEESTITITAEVGCTGETGVEMEALTAASVAALTVYDMCKAVQRDIRIGDICLLYKSGGKSGEYKREDAENG